MHGRTLQAVSKSALFAEVLRSSLSERFILSDKASKRLTYGHIVCREPSEFSILPEECKALM